MCRQNSVPSEALGRIPPLPLPASGSYLHSLTCGTLIFKAGNIFQSLDSDLPAFFFFLNKDPSAYIGPT